jgi:MoaA/NifB/PqqE/SkfB family radical SAM enzyme
MNLLVLFRSRLEWCNYTCSYCPWNATLTRVSREEFLADEARVISVVERVAELSRPVEFFITPKAEYLVLPYWRAAVARLTHLPQVARVTVQTNLSFDLPAFLETVAPGKLALWTTFHPSEVPATAVERLHERWALLHARSIPFSVGLVGTHENLSYLEPLRQHLPSDVYLWVNAYKREANYYSPADLARIRAVDPLFDLNNQHFPSLGRPCTAGQLAVYLDDEGDLRRCFFVGRVLGNLFRDGWTPLPEAEVCPNATCHCYVGHMHIPELNFRSIYGENLAVRIPKRVNSEE